MSALYLWAQGSVTVTSVRQIDGDFWPEYGGTMQSFGQEFKLIVRPTSGDLHIGAVSVLNSTVSGDIISATTSYGVWGAFTVPQGECFTLEWGNPSGRSGEAFGLMGGNSASDRVDIGIAPASSSTTLDFMLFSS